MFMPKLRHQVASINGGGKDWLNTPQVEKVPDYKFRKDSAKTLALIPAKERKRPWIGFDGTSLQKAKRKQSYIVENSQGKNSLRSISSHEYVFLNQSWRCFHPKKSECSRQLLDVVGTKIALSLAFKLKIPRKVIYR